MGFRTGAYAKIWDVQPKTQSVTVLQLSTSTKQRGSDEYTTDFSGFCSCLGETAATAARGLHKGDRIKLGDVEVKTSYVKESKKTYTNYNIYSFEVAGEQKKANAPVDEFDPTDVPEGSEEEGLPF